MGLVLVDDRVGRAASLDSPFVPGSGNPGYMRLQTASQLADGLALKAFQHAPSCIPKP